MFTRKLNNKEQEIIKRIIQFVEDKHKNELGHDYSHVLEVCRWAIEIGNKIPDPADPFVAICGALLHDIGRVGAPDGRLHGIDGGARVYEFLASLGVDDETTRKITRIVVRHSPTSHIPPQSIEEKIVFDADDIERLGLMGMIRGIMGKQGSLEYIINYRIKSRLADYQKLFFEESKELAAPYYAETLKLSGRLEKALSERLSEIHHIESGKAIGISPEILQYVLQTQEA